MADKKELLEKLKEEKAQMLETFEDTYKKFLASTQAERIYMTQCNFEDLTNLIVENYGGSYDNARNIVLAFLELFVCADGVVTKDEFIMYCEIAKYVYDNTLNYENWLEFLNSDIAKRVRADCREFISSLDGKMKTVLFLFGVGIMSCDGEISEKEKKILEDILLGDI